MGAIVAALGRLGFLPRCHWDPSRGEQRVWVQPLDDLGAALVQALPQARPQVRLAWRVAWASSSQAWDFTGGQACCQRCVPPAR